MAYHELISHPVWRGWVLLLDKVKVEVKDTYINEEKLLPSKIKTARMDQFEILRYLLDHCRELYEGKRDFKLSDLKKEELVRHIKLNASTHAQFERSMDFLISGIHLGNEIGLWEINPPVTPLFRKSFHSQISSKTMAARKSMAMLNRGFFNSLERIDSLGMGQRAGQLIFSAVVFSGIFNLKKLEDWIESLNDEVRTSEGYTWACLISDKQTKKDLIPQMWFADPITEALYYNWCKSYNMSLKAALNGHHNLIGKIWHTLEMYLNTIAPKGYHVPTSCNEFLRWGKSRVALEVHPFLLDFASSLRSSTSLPPQAWLRLRKNCFITKKHNSQPLSIQLGNLRSSVARKLNPPRRSDQKHFKSKIYEFVRESRKKNFGNGGFQSTVSQFQAWVNSSVQMYPITRIFAEWAIDMVCNTDLTAHTITDYLCKTSRLYEVSDSLDILNLDEGQITEIYEQFVAKLECLKDPGEYCLKLVYFHQFIVQKYAAPDVNFSEIEGFCAPVHRVDANIISFDEYERIKHVFCGEICQLKGSRNSYNWRVSCIQYLIVILGFRCGLRTSEVLKLRVKDVCLGTTDPEMYIRNLSDRELKTANAIRKIPLKVCLEDNELNALKKWLQMRYTEVQGNMESPLFTGKGASKRSIWRPAIFPAIHLVMREVTGDETVHFHHLRHSFANWTLVKLMAPSCPELLKSSFLKDQGITASQEFALALSGGTHPGSEMLYALARIMGHSSSSTTFSRYIHLLDVILLHVLRQTPSELNRNIAMKLFRVSQTTAYRLENRAADRLIQNLRRVLDSKDFLQRFRDPLESQIHNHPRLYGSPDTKVVGSFPMCEYGDMDMWQFMKIHRDQGMTWYQISQCYGISIHSLEHWWEAAQSISEIRTRSQQQCIRTFVRKSGNRQGRARIIRPVVDGMPTRHHFIPALNSEGEILEAKALLERMHELPKKHSMLLEHCTLDFMNRVTPSGSELIFDDTKKAKTYLKFLKLIGVTENRIVGLHYSATKTDDKCQKLQRQWWAGKLGLPPTAIIHRDYSATRETGAHGWVSIIVRHHKEQKVIKNLNIRRLSAYSLRYAIHTYAVHLFINSSMRAVA